MTEPLRWIEVAGPKLASPAGTSPVTDLFVWSATLAVPFTGAQRDVELVNSTFGIRVLLQTPESDPTKGNLVIDWAFKKDWNLTLRTPQLLTALVQPRRRLLKRSKLRFAGTENDYDLYPAVPTEDPEAGKVSRGFSPLVLVPREPWPSPQLASEKENIPTPRFRIGEQRLRVLVSARGGTWKNPAGFLRLVRTEDDDTVAAFVAPEPWNGHDKASLPRVELPAVHVTGLNFPLVAMDLTQHGLEFRGTVIDPMATLEGNAAPPRVGVLLRLVHEADPLDPSQTVWSLQLVREGDKRARIRAALDAIRTAFAPGKTVFLDIDTGRSAPAVRWPLVTRMDYVFMDPRRDELWRMWVDSSAVASRLVGAPVRHGQLPTTIDVVVDRLALAGTKNKVSVTLEADRRGRATPRVEDIPGPRVNISWQTGKSASEASVSADPKEKRLSWYLDTFALGRDLVARYTRAGVHPAGAATTYAFLPVVDGWLQLPLPTAAPAKEPGKHEGEHDVPAPLDTAFETVLAESEDGPTGRRLAVDAVDFVRATGTIVAGAQGPNLEHVDVELWGAAGKVDGVIWIAAASPSPQELLPPLDAGPAAVVGPALGFSRPTAQTRGLTKIVSDTFQPGVPFGLELAPAQREGPLAYVWHAYPDMPLVTAVSMTRTAASRGTPSATRGLVCHEVQPSTGLKLAYGADHGVPRVEIASGPVDHIDRLPLAKGQLANSPFARVPLVALTLPGIEFETSANPFPALQARLRFDLPVLDELFATTRLPDKAPVASAKGPPVESAPADAPTSLDPPRLVDAWQAAADRLDLSRVQNAWAFDWRPQAAGDAVVSELFEPATWATTFALHSQSDIEKSKYAFGAYTLAGEAVTAPGALEGLTKSFAVDLTTLVAEAKPTPRSLRVVGFATNLWQQEIDGKYHWRDTRGATASVMPTTEPCYADGVPDKNGLVIRASSIIDGKGKPTPFWRATVARPVTVAVEGSPARRCGLWFRDLPLHETKKDTRRFVTDGDNAAERAIGPKQSAFDPSILPLSVYEWRFCNDADALAPAAYEVALGPFQFRPLRLLDLTLERQGDGNWQVTSAQIVGALGSRVLDEGRKEAGPFAPDRDYATGNLFAVTLRKAGLGLTLGKAAWDKALVVAKSKDKHVLMVEDAARVVVLRFSDVPVYLGPSSEKDGCGRQRTTLLLSIEIDKEGLDTGLPRLRSAALDIVLFGRVLHLDQGTVSYGENNAVVATFNRVGHDAGTGVELDSVKVTWSSAGSGAPCTVRLRGTLRVVASDMDGPDKATSEVVSYALGETLWWANLKIPASKDLFATIDHEMGTISIAMDPSEAAAREPIRGLRAESASLRGCLVMAIERAQRPAPGTTSGYFLPSVSGFGALHLVSAKGPTRRFDHAIKGAGMPVWRSRIEVDLALERRPSRIHWPIGSLPCALHPTEALATTEEFDHLAARVRGRALRGEFTPYDAGSVLLHTVTVAIRAQRIATGLLRVTPPTDATERVVSFGGAWTFYALVRHELRSSENTSLSWTTLDHVNAVDSRQLLDAAKASIESPKNVEDGIYAFGPRYAEVAMVEAVNPVARPGIVLRAFAQAGFPVEALAKAIANDLAIGNGIIVTGAGPSVVCTDQEVAENPFWPEASSSFATPDAHGLVVSLPWLTTVDFPGAGELVEFKQAPAAKKAEWDAPDIDWAAGSPMPLARMPATTEVVRAGSASEIAGMLARAMSTARPEHAAVPLAAVEQVFLSGSGEIGERPMWLRTLLALRTMWQALATQSKAIDRSVTMVVPSGRADGRVGRFQLAVQATPSPGDELAIAYRGQLVAIDRRDTKLEALPASEAGKRSGTPGATERGRLVGRAQRLVKEPVALIAIAAEGTGMEASASIWSRIDVPRDLDDGALDIAITLPAKDRVYASPALGWPTKAGTELAATGALGMGDDRPFQDGGIWKTPDPTSKDIKDYGSGLSGRTASLSLPARADRCTSKTPDAKVIDVRSPIYYALGRKMTFQRPMKRPLQITSPPARHLAPTEARAVVPVARDLEAALARVVQGQAAPIVPPHIERTSFGLRPGALQTEFDMLLFTDAITPETEDMDPEFGRFGRPGHAGPRVLRQLRPPRGVTLPRVPVEFVATYGRRTFVAQDVLDEDPKFTKPFLLFEGVATVARRDYENREESYGIRVLGTPLTPKWEGTLELLVSSSAKDLPKALAELGLLCEDMPERAGLAAALSIDREVFPFATATWQSPDDVVITLTLKSGLTGLRARLDEVDGDSEVLLLMRCAKQCKTNKAPDAGTEFKLALADPTQSERLEPETRRQFALRIPVRPNARPSLPIETSTLVFADPSYDRELSGPGASDAQRDANGVLWKLGLDRFEYGTDTPIYFTFGAINPESGAFGDASEGIKGELTLLRQPAVNGAKNILPEHIAIKGVKAAEKSPTKKPHYAIDGNKAYGITLDRLCYPKDDRPLHFLDGDEIVVSIAFETNGVPRILSSRALVVQWPVVAPPPAMYALVTTDGDKEARVTLHATAPLPQRVEFPDLPKDLAVGYIRRRALFIWPVATMPYAAPVKSTLVKSTLVKFDRAGGGQVPERAVDIRPREALP